MSLNINSATFGQPPYFDISTLFFDPIGDEYNYGTHGINLLGYNKAIQYGESFGNSRIKLCARRYIFKFNLPSNTFVYYKTYEGNREGAGSSVIDVTNLNNAIQENILEIINEDEPTFLSNSILHSLFNFPSHNDYFFVEGAHFKVRERTRTATTNAWRPNFFKIRRYGKISPVPFNGEISTVLVYKENTNIQF